MQQSEETTNLLKSLNDNGDPTPKQPLRPQLFASVAVGTFFLTVGYTMGYSVIFVPQIMDEQNCGNCSDVVPVTLEDTAWFVSVIRLTAPMCSLLGGLVMDMFGRLNLLKIAVVPSILGWLLIAVANSKTLIMLGRILTGISAAWSIGVPTYISEISSPELRGCLIAVSHLYVSLGVLIILIEGSFIHWRWTAWFCTATAALPAFLLIFLHESSPWLSLKNRIVEARASLKWFTNSKTNKDEEAVEKELEQLVEKNVPKLESETNTEHAKIKMYLKLFFKSTFYKPMFIMLGLFLLQQVSGTYIIAFYAVTFVKNIGTTTNPYLVAISLGIVRFIIAIANIWLTKAYNRCTLLNVSSIGMCLSIGASAIYTKWMLQGTANYQWMPLVLLMIYVLFATSGLSTVPFIVLGEVFPLEIRGVAQNLILTIASFLMFATVQLYYTLNDFLGPSGLQYLFSVTSLTSVVYTYMWVPETHNKTLLEIEEHFVSNRVLAQAFEESPDYAIYGSTNKDTSTLQNNI